jgi:hypothetical protein
VPSEEPRAQTTEADYFERGRAECKRYVALLRQQWPDRPDGLDFRVMHCPHESGIYFDVGVFFDGDDKRHVEFAAMIESHLPKRWED